MTGRIERRLRSSAAQIHQRENDSEKDPERNMSRTKRKNIKKIYRGVRATRPLKCAAAERVSRENFACHNDLSRIIADAGG
jgi:hypothetical protein